MAQQMATCSPVCGDGLANGIIVRRGVGVDIASVRQLAAGGTVDAVDLGVGESLQCWQAQLLGQCVDARVSEQFLACLIGGSSLWFLRGGGGLWLCNGVVASVFELQEASEGIDVFARELDAALVRVCLLEFPFTAVALVATLTEPDESNLSTSSVRNGESRSRV